VAFLCPEHVFFWPRPKEKMFKAQNHAKTMPKEEGGASEKSSAVGKSMHPLILACIPSFKIPHFFPFSPMILGRYHERNMTQGFYQCCVCKCQ
jgi:hypothetical protein